MATVTLTDRQARLLREVVLHYAGHAHTARLRDALYRIGHRMDEAIAADVNAKAARPTRSR